MAFMLPKKELSYFSFGTIMVQSVNYLSTIILRAKPLIDIKFLDNYTRKHENVTKRLV